MKVDGNCNFVILEDELLLNHNVLHRKVFPFSLPCPHWFQKDGQIIRNTCQYNAVQFNNT